jgi:hypothetical protein
MDYVNAGARAWPIGPVRMADARVGQPLTEVVLTLFREHTGLASVCLVVAKVAWRAPTAHPSPDWATPHVSGASSSVG